MGDRMLKRLIAQLDRLNKANDLTGDGWHWLQALKRERDRREANPQHKVNK